MQASDPVVDGVGHDHLTRGLGSRSRGG
jgi:hypothetical protein